MYNIHTYYKDFKFEMYVQYTRFWICAKELKREEKTREGFHAEFKYVQKTLYLNSIYIILIGLRGWDWIKGTVLISLVCLKLDEEDQHKNK